MITIDFAVPPSVNRLWRMTTKKGASRIYKDPRHDNWLKEFWYRWHLVKPEGFKTITSEFDAEILVCPKYKRDADASAKAVLDAAQAIGIIKNDSQARRVTQELVGKDKAPLGARLRIIPR